MAFLVNLGNYIGIQIADPMFGKTQRSAVVVKFWTRCVDEYHIDVCFYQTAFYNKIYGQLDNNTGCSSLRL